MIIIHKQLRWIPVDKVFAGKDSNRVSRLGLAACTEYSVRSRHIPELHMHLDTLGLACENEVLYLRILYIPKPETRYLKN